MRSGLDRNARRALYPSHDMQDDKLSVVFYKGEDEVNIMGAIAERILWRGLGLAGYRLKADWSLSGTSVEADHGI